jgi:hypothetical protein
MNHVAIDEYVLDVLLPDLAGHDKSPSAFLVYLVLWTLLFRSGQRSAPVSLHAFTELTGLSKSAVQRSVRILKRRGLIQVTTQTPTAIPEYALIRHWLRRRVKRS